MALLVRFGKANMLAIQMLGRDHSTAIQTTRVRIHNMRRKLSGTPLRIVNDYGWGYTLEIDA